MQLTKKEKRKIFWSLIDKYPEHERGRTQVRDIFKCNPERLVEALDNIESQEEESYILMKRFSDELCIDIPDRDTKPFFS